MTSFVTLKEEVRSSMEVKKSKFFTFASPVTNDAGALEYLEKVKDRSANHNCWAYKVGNNFRHSDDGEPGGTAGKPILAAIEGSGLDRVVVVVTRYFGGIKLGTGGLVRAYGSAAASCLKGAPTVVVKAQRKCFVVLPFDLLGVAYGQLQAHGVTQTKEEYTDGGVEILLVVEHERLESLRAALKEASGGKIVLHD